MNDSRESNGNLSQRIKELEKENIRLHKDLERILKTRSWRWTFPVRTFQKLIRTFRHRLKPQKILYIDSQLPLTDRDSGSVRLFNLLRLLARSRRNITFIPFDLKDHPEASAALRKFGIRVLCSDHINSISAHLEADGSTYDVIILCRMPIAHRYLEEVKFHAPDAKIIFDTVDLHFLRLERQAELQHDLLLRTEAVRCKQCEIDLMHQSDCTIVVSEAERKILKNSAPHIPVFLLSNIHQVLAKPSWNENRTSILFLGSFNHAPNRDAVHYLVEQILPLVRREIPDVVLEIIGDGPMAEFEDISCANIHIHGYVPDLTPYFARTRVFAAPLRYGAGVKGKLHMSMAYGVPFVTTAIGAEGMHIQHEEHALIADDENAFAENIIRLYRDHDLWLKLAVSSQQILQQKFSEEAATKEIRRMFLFLERR